MLQIQVPEGLALSSKFNKDFVEHLTFQNAYSVAISNLCKRVTYVYASVKYFLL